MLKSKLQQNFLKEISNNPKITLSDLHNNLERETTLESDRHILYSLQYKNLIKIYKNKNIKNYKIECTEKGYQTVEEYFEDNKDEIKSGVCSKCKKETDNLIRFKKQDLCGECLTDAYYIQTYNVIRSNLII